MPGYNDNEIRGDLITRDYRSPVSPVAHGSDDGREAMLEQLLARGISVHPTTKTGLGWDDFTDGLIGRLWPEHRDHGYKAFLDCYAIGQMRRGVLCGCNEALLADELVIHRTVEAHIHGVHPQRLVID